MSKKSQIFGFSLYDFANSAYILIFNSFLYPIYFKEVIFSNHTKSDFYWGMSIAISVIIAVLISPIIGFLADKTNRKKVLAICVILITLGIVNIVLIPSDSLFLNIISFILLNCLFIVSLTIYDSFLPGLVPPPQRITVSGFAWGFGYIGGIIAFLIILLIQGGQTEPNKLAFLITAIFFAIFGVLAILLLPSQRADLEDRKIKFNKAFKIVIKPGLIILLFGIWFINDAIDGLIHFVGIYGRTTLQIDVRSIGIVFLLIQFIAFPATWLISILAKRVGLRLIINLSLIIWALLIIALLFSPRKTELLFLVLPGGLVIGTTQALLRAFFSNQIPENMAGFSFGLYSIATRASTIFGPLVFGALSSSTGNEKIGMISLLVMLIIGTYIFWFFSDLVGKSLDDFK